MAYKHQKEVQVAVAGVVKVVSDLMDNVDDKTQAFEIAAAGMQAFNAASSAVGAETKKELKAKFLVMLAAALLARLEMLMVPDEA